MESKKLSETKHMGIKRKALDEGGCTKLYSSSTQNQTLLQCINRGTVAWPTNSHEYKINSLLHMINATCNPVRLVDNATFRKFVKTFELKLAMPASAKLNSILNEDVTVLRRKYRDLISEGRRFTISLEGWTK